MANAELKVVEGVESTWHYHLAPADKPFTALCGATSMHTGIPLDRWGRTPANYHIPEKWCAKCRSIADERAAKAAL